MTRSPNIPCSVCGKLCWPSYGFSKAEQPTKVCRECRGWRPDGQGQQPKLPKCCLECGGPKHSPAHPYCSTCRDQLRRSKRPTRTCSQCDAPVQPRFKFCPGCSDARRIKPAGSCVRCGEPKPSAKRYYCDECKEVVVRQEPGRTTRLGYGRQHQKMREKIKPLVEQGGFTCTRYGHPQFPDCPGEIQPGDDWELGHDDTDKTRYTGPEHRGCNRRAGGLKRIGKLLIENETQLHW